MVDEPDVGCGRDVADSVVDAVDAGAGHDAEDAHLKLWAVFNAAEAGVREAGVGGVLAGPPGGLVSAGGGQMIAG